jgi:fucose permease
LLTAGYWAALALGRIASGAYFAGRRDPGTLLAVSVAGAGISSVLLVASSGNIGLAAVAAFGAGFFFGPIWPATTAIAAANSSADATAATVTIGNSGGLAIPWLQGVVLVSAGPTEGVAMTAVLCGLMLAIVLAFRARRRGPMSIGI